MSEIKIPEFIVTTFERPEPHEVQFPELYKIKLNISSLMLLWDFHSYYVSIDDGYFIINGGRRVQPTMVHRMVNRELEYAKRNKLELSLGCADFAQDGEVLVSYLIGITGMVDNEKKSVLIQVTSDGEAWCWKDHR